MKKVLYFLRWMFDWSRWYGFQKRYTIYFILGIGIALVTGIRELFWSPAILVWFDLTISLLKEKWDKFNKEQNEMLETIKGKK